MKVIKPPVSQKKVVRASWSPSKVLATQPSQPGWLASQYCDAEIPGGNFPSNHAYRASGGMNQARDRTAGNPLLMRIASNLYIKMAAPVWPFSCNTGIKVTSAGIASPAGVIRPLLWVRFFGRIQKRISDLRSYGFFTTKKKRKIRKRIIYDFCAHLFRTVFLFSKNRLSKIRLSNLFPKNRSDRESQKYGFGFDPKNPP